MKKMLLYCILLFSSYSVYGQNIKYSYDLAGNCISRKMETVQKYSDSNTLDNENNINNETQIRLVCRTPSAISMCRKQLYKKLFNKEGTPVDFDSFIVSF